MSKLSRSRRLTRDGLASRPGEVAILLGMLHAKETGISSGRVGLWLGCAFTSFNRGRKLNATYVAQLVLIPM